MCVEPYIYNTAAHRDHRTEIQYIAFALQVVFAHI